MQRAVKGGVTTDYLYNALGQRVSKKRITATSFTNYYAYDEQGQLMGEYLGDGKPIQETVYLGSTPVAVLAGGIYYVYADHIDTARVITSSVDNVPVWRWDKADPFGAQLPEMNPHGRGVFTYNPRFPGQLFDKETNNHYNYFRDYDPQTGRYIQSGPIGLSGGINTYGYVGGNPLTFYDFFGLTRAQVDYMTKVAKCKNPDLKVPDYVHISPNFGGVDTAVTNPITLSVTLSNYYNGDLDGAGMISLYKTIVHESIHRTRPRIDMITRPFDHPDIYAEAAKRAKDLEGGKDACLCEK